MKIARIFTNYFWHYYTLFGNGKGRSVMASYSDFKKVIEAIWKTVRHRYIYNEGGVYIDNIGYLCHIIRPESKPGNSIRISVRNKKRKKKGGYNYRHISIPVGRSRKSVLSKYIFLEPLKSIKEESEAVLLAGYRYRFLYREVIEHLRKVHTFRIKRIYNEDLKCKSRILS